MVIGVYYDGCSDYDINNYGDNSNNCDDDDDDNNNNNNNNNNNCDS